MQTISRTEPAQLRRLAFRRSRGNTYREDGQGLVLLGGEGSRWSMRRADRRHGAVLWALSAGSRWYLRDRGGRVLRATRLEHADGGGFDLIGLHRLRIRQPLRDDEEDALVRYAPNLRRFEASNVDFEGQWMPETGRFEGFLERPSGRRLRVEGLAGRHLAVLRVGAGPVAILPVCQEPDGSYRIFGMRSALGLRHAAAMS